MGAVWTSNSAAYSTDLFTEDYCGITYASVALGGLILIHGIFIHGRKYNSVRIQTDLASASAVISGLLFFPLKIYENPYSSQSLLIFDFFYVGFFPLVIQLCDNYMFYSRLMAVSKVPAWKRYAMHLYVILILSATWFPMYSIVPFFYDTNNAAIVENYFITLSVQVWGTVAYNFYFTIEFAIILRNINSGKASQTDTLKKSSKLRAIISIKSIIHCMASSLASLIYLYIPAVGNPIYVIMIISGMHILFNSRVEKYIILVSKCCPIFPSYLFHHSSQVFLSPSEATEMNGLKGYRDVSVGLKTIALTKANENALTVANGTMPGGLVINTKEQMILPQRIKSPIPLHMRTAEL